MLKYMCLIQKSENTDYNEYYYTIPFHISNIYIPAFLLLPFDGTDFWATSAYVVRKLTKSSIDRKVCTPWIVHTAITATSITPISNVFNRIAYGPTEL